MSNMRKKGLAYKPDDTTRSKRLGKGGTDATTSEETL